MLDYILEGQVCCFNVEIKYVFFLNMCYLIVCSYIYYILITIRVSKMTKVTSQALYKKNIEIKEKKKNINQSSDDF